MTEGWAIEVSFQGKWSLHDFTRQKERRVKERVKALRKEYGLGFRYTKGLMPTEEYEEIKLKEVKERVEDSIDRFRDHQNKVAYGWDPGSEDGDNSTLVGIEQGPDGSIRVIGEDERPVGPVVVDQSTSFTEETWDRFLNDLYARGLIRREPFEFPDEAQPLNPEIEKLTQQRFRPVRRPRRGPGLLDGKRGPIL